MEVARWPWHRTAFYLEWIEEAAEAADRAAEPMGLDPTVLARAGAQVREI